MKIVQIEGIKGIITAVFVCACAFAGFVISPGYAAMYLWNKYLAQPYMFPTLSLFQGVLLWGIIVISYFIVTKNGFALSFKNTPEMSDEELNSIIKSAKINAQMRMMNRIISKSDNGIQFNNNEKPEKINNYSCEDESKKREAYKNLIYYNKNFPNSKEKEAKPPFNYLFLLTNLCKIFVIYTNEGPSSAKVV